MENRPSPPKPEEIDRVLAALANPVRRQILDDLDTNIPMEVSYLLEELSMTRQGVRKHLEELMKAGIVRRRRTGRTALYYIDPRPIRKVFAALTRRYWRDLRPLRGWNEP